MVLLSYIPSVTRFRCTDAKIVRSFDGISARSGGKAVPGRIFLKQV